MNSFEDLFEELAKTNDRSIIWNNWLDYCILQATINNQKNKVSFMGNEKQYYELLTLWLNELGEELETRPYYDMLGYFYESLVQSRSKSKSLGQMYTPHSVTSLLSELANISDGVVNDPTCGSGRTLLSAYVQSQGRTVVVGQDLDATSCKMAVLNFWSHGVRGSVLHMNTLELEFYEAWRVNNYLGYGLNIPHIELVPEKEAYHFIGCKESLMVNDKKEVEKEDSVQSVLI